MQYSDTLDDSRRHLRLALEWIGKYGLPTDPLNYCIWYEYASGKNQKLKTAIDTHIEESGAFEERINKRLFNEFVADPHEKVVASVREDLERLFSEIISSIVDTSDHFSESEDHLETINKGLVPNLPKSSLEIIVTQIRGEIKELESTSSSFRKQLKQANEEIDSLKTKIKSYRDEVFRDPLTQIANRRKFDRELEGLINKANATGASLCLIMADIDHFKKINDNHGHLVGDNVLRIVAKTIEDSIKGKDLVARIGGEEFAILLPDTPFAGAMKLAEIIRLIFDKLDLKKKNTKESLGNISISFGVTAYNAGESTESLMKRADKALYQSKKTGRNRVSGL